MLTLFLLRNINHRHHLVNLGIHRKIISQHNLKKYYTNVLLKVQYSGCIE